jgi:hypothetical protein
MLVYGLALGWLGFQRRLMHYLSKIWMDLIKT